MTSPRLEQTHSSSPKSWQLSSHPHLPVQVLITSPHCRRTEFLATQAPPLLHSLRTCPQSTTSPPFPQQARTSRSWHPRLEGSGPAPTHFSASVAATRAHHVFMSCHAHRLCAHCVIAIHCRLNCCTPPLCPKKPPRFTTVLVALRRQQRRTVVRPLTCL